MPSFSAASSRPSSTIPNSKRHLTAILEDLGCDLHKTYFDVPRMRSSTSGDYLTTGIAYAWHAHRDTWYSAPPSQINWWLPIYDLHSDNAMAFHPRYWSEPVKNSSAGYNYYLWNKLHRGEKVAKLVKEDTRPLPKASEPIELDPQIRLICPVGGLILFSAAQMHSSVPNTSGLTRFSIDFRTVHRDDVVRQRGAPNVDFGLHRNRDARLPARQRPLASAGGNHRPLRRRDGGGRRTDLCAEERLAAALHPTGTTH